MGAISLLVLGPTPETVNEKDPRLIFDSHRGRPSYFLLRGCRGFSRPSHLDAHSIRHRPQSTIVFDFDRHHQNTVTVTVTSTTSMDDINANLHDIMSSGNKRPAGVTTITPTNDDRSLPKRRIEDALMTEEEMTHWSPDNEDNNNNNNNNNSYYKGSMCDLEYYRFRYVPTSHIRDIATNHRLYRWAPTQETIEVRMSIPTKKAGYAIGPLLTMTLTLSSSPNDDEEEEEAEVVALKSATNTKIQMEANRRRRMATTMTASRYPQPQQESHHPSWGCDDNRGVLVLELFGRGEQEGVPTEGASHDPDPSMTSEAVEMLMLLSGGSSSSVSSCW